MKKILFVLIPVIMVIIGCVGNPQPTASYSGITLDQAMKEAAEEIDGRFQANSKIALVNFNSPSDQLSVYVFEELTSNLVGSRHLEVIDRQEVDLRRRELNFQMSGEVSDDSMQALGRTLGAQYIVSGSFTSIGNIYRIVIRALNVENGRVEVQYRQDIANNDRVQALMTNQNTSGTPFEGIWDLVDDDSYQQLAFAFIGNTVSQRDGGWYEGSGTFTFTRDMITIYIEGRIYNWRYSIQGNLMSLRTEEGTLILQRRPIQ